MKARYRWAERNAARDDRVPAPLGYKIVLTYKCNLRCIMCYEWGEVGWCHEAPKRAAARPGSRVSARMPAMATAATARMNKKKRAARLVWRRFSRMRIEITLQ